MTMPSRKVGGSEAGGGHHGAAAAERGQHLPGGVPRMATSMAVPTTAPIWRKQEAAATPAAKPRPGRFGGCGAADGGQPSFPELSDCDREAEAALRPHAAQDLTAGVAVRGDHRGPWR